MLKTILLPLVLLILLFVGFKPVNTPEPSNDNFCDKLKNLLESSRQGFSSVKGEAVERMITGNKKKFFISKVRFTGEHECYLNDSEAYPECECILATDRTITEQLTRQYEDFTNVIISCLPTGYTMTEQDSTNNFYLKGTKFKKYVVQEQEGEQKVRFHLYMYSSMIEKKRVVELKIEGIGKK
ncbi:MAG: hypothetical protein ABII90_05960 [Bacteroidota bacterium]